MEVKDELSRLTFIVEQIGLAVIATTDTVEKLANRLEDLATQVAQEGEQIRQQNYQIFALTDSLQRLVDSQNESRKQTEQLINALNDFVVNIKNHE